MLLLALTALAAKPSHEGMSLIPPGEFKPPFASDSGLKSVPVKPFWIDKAPVSQQEFRDFVFRRKEWRKSALNPIFRDANYLRDWKHDTLPPSETPRKKPVTQISWHAAKAYCADLGKRLPTTMEWERMAGSWPAGSDSAKTAEAILQWFGRPAGLGLPDIGAGIAQDFGVKDMHGLIWEWTSDYKSWGFARFGLTSEDSARFCGGGGNKGNADDYIAFMRYGFRQSLEPQFTVSSLGFRCARDASAEEAERVASVEVKTTGSPLPDSSLYRLESWWLNDGGDSLRLANLRGKPRLLSMFFSRCESVCPMLLGQLKGLEQDLPADLRRAFGFVMITMDTERDSVAALETYRSQMVLDTATWQILRGGPDDTRELALLLGVEYQPGPRGQIDHNGLIALVDADGRIIRRVSSIGDRKAFIQVMRDMVQKPETGPSRRQSRAIKSSR